MTHEQMRERREAIANFVRKNHTVVEACVKFCVGVRTVYMACEEHNVFLNGAYKIHSTSSLRVVKLLLDGGTVKSVAAKAKLSKQRVSNIKKLAVEAGFDV